MTNWRRGSLSLNVEPQHFHLSPNDSEATVANHPLISDPESLSRFPEQRFFRQLRTDTEEKQTSQGIFRCLENAVFSRHLKGPCDVCCCSIISRNMPMVYFVESTMDGLLILSLPTKHPEVELD